MGGVTAFHPYLYIFVLWPNEWIVSQFLFWKKNLIKTSSDASDRPSKSSFPLEKLLDSEDN